MPDTNTTLSIVERMKIMAQIHTLVKMYFGHWEALPHDYDFDAVFNDTLEQVVVTDDRYQFTLQMMALIASLRNGHSFYRDNYVQSKTTFGFQLNHYQQQWVVTQSGYSELPVGAIVETFNGQPTEDFFQEYRYLIHASSEHEARHNFSRLHVVLDNTVTLGLDDGRAVTLARDVVLAAPTETIGRWLETDQIAYIHIPRFMPPHFEERAIELVNEFQAASHLIIDIRGNTGGTTPSQLICHLLKQPTRNVISVTPLHISIFQAYAQTARVFGDNMSSEWKTIGDMAESYSKIGIYNPADIISPHDTIFDGQLVILADGHTGSAAEDFTIPFKTGGEATIIGTRTNGSAGQPFIIQYNDDISMRVSTRRIYFPDGTPFEGVGITPDIDVEPTIADLKSGRDTILETALEYIRQSSA